MTFKNFGNVELYSKDVLSRNKTHWDPYSLPIWQAINQYEGLDEIGISDIIRVPFDAFENETFISETHNYCQ